MDLVKKRKMWFIMRKIIRRKFRAKDKIIKKYKLRIMF
jgi:hypothetical protein